MATMTDDATGTSPAPADATSTEPKACGDGGQGVLSQAKHEVMIGTVGGAFEQSSSGPEVVGIQTPKGGYRYRSKHGRSPSDSVEPNDRGGKKRATASTGRRTPEGFRR